MLVQRAPFQEPGREGLGGHGDHEARVVEADDADAVRAVYRPRRLRTPPRRRRRLRGRGGRQADGTTRCRTGAKDDTPNQLRKKRDMEVFLSERIKRNGECVRWWMSVTGRACGGRLSTGAADARCDGPRIHPSRQPQPGYSQAWTAIGIARVADRLANAFHANGNRMPRAEHLQGLEELGASGRLLDDDDATRSLAVVIATRGETRGVAVVTVAVSENPIQASWMGSWLACFRC